MAELHNFWLIQAADKVEEHIANKKEKGAPIICAAGMTPSCPIHAGILREGLISYFVTKELQSRGWNAQFIFYWDDFDHFVKIPYYSTHEEVKEHIGKPLCDTPDIHLNKFDSYGAHNMFEFEDCLTRLGINPVYNYQSELYKNGVYLKYIKTALEKRLEIFDIIKKKNDKKQDNNERNNFFPLEVYCEHCNRDFTVTTQYSLETGDIRYYCKNCNTTSIYNIDKFFYGKLIWKVNWAMRWAVDAVDFESSGENHLTKTGSYSVASKIVGPVFNGSTPYILEYRFLGAPGIAKISRAQGEHSLAKRYVDLIEPVVLRWLFLQNRPEKPFIIDIEKGLNKIYHEWDSFLEKINHRLVDETDEYMYRMCTAEDLDYCEIPIAFRTLSTSISVAGGDTNTALKIISRYVNVCLHLGELKKKLEPRFTCALKWVTKYGNEEEIMYVNKECNKEVYESLSERNKKAIHYIAENLRNGWTEEKLIDIFYKASRYSIDMPLDAPPDDELKKAQKELFTSLYLLITGKTKGPRLNTLFMMLSREHIQKLLSP